MGQPPVTALLPDGAWYGPSRIFEGTRLRSTSIEYDGRLAALVFAANRTLSHTPHIRVEDSASLVLAGGRQQAGTGA